MRKTIAELNAIKGEKNDAKREEKALEYLANENDCGRNGRVWELKCTPKLSTKTCVSAANRRDNYIRVKLDDERIVQQALECKSNGGRVDSLFTNEFTIGFTGAKFVSYKYEYELKHKAGKRTEAWTERRVLPGLLIPKNVFVNALLSDKSFLKPVYHGGVQDGIAIQVSSKKWYERLKTYAENYPDLLFDRDKIYESWQFEGVEL